MRLLRCDCATDGVLVFEREGLTEYHCKTCAQRYALYSAAFDHLAFLTRQAVKAWLPNWQGLPGVPDLEEQFRHIGAQMEEEYKAGLLKQEEVQPFRVTGKVV